MTSPVPAVDATLMKSRRFSVAVDFIAHLLYEVMKLSRLRGGLPAGSGCTFRTCTGCQPSQHQYPHLLAWGSTQGAQQQP
jgi:hypothetical protein